MTEAGTSLSTAGPSRIVVLGSNSFSGASFVAHCLKQGWEVIGISRSPEADEVFLPYRWITAHDALTRFRFMRLDLNSDLAEILRVVAEKPCHVVNFAAQSMVAESWQNPDHWYQTNVLANVRLHEGLRRLAQLRRYVHVSTPEVYGTCKGIVTEQQPFQPSTPYAASRAACELHLQTFVKQYGFPAIITRAANVCGPGQQLYRIIPRSLINLELGRRIPLHGGGWSMRSFIHVADVATGTLLAAERGMVGEAFHLSTRRMITIRDLVSLICSQAGMAWQDCVDIVADRPGNDAAYLLDSKLARTQLGWADQSSLENTINETRSWIRQNLDRLRNLPQEYMHKP
jgi:dTDP-glucose 4,6-dehydratase